MQKSKRIQNIPPYIFAKIDQKREEVRAKGVDIIDLSIGDPDLPTPPHIVEAMHRAIDDPRTHDYPPYEGTAEFRRAVADWYKKRFKVDLDPESEVMALIGSKEGIAHIFPAFVDPGDITLVPDPGYPVYKIGTLLSGGIPHFLPMLAENKFLPDLKKIDKQVLKAAKLIFVNYPNNPTGAVCNKAFLEEVVKLAKDNDLLICSDLAYSEMGYDGYRATSMLEIPGAKEITLEFHSLSKTYNMTGWRIGMAVGGREAIAALGIIKTNTDSGAFKAIQRAGVAALIGPQDCIVEMQKLYARRRNVFIEGLNRLGWDLEKPKATFYVWVPVPKGFDSAGFTTFLLEEVGISVVPGSGYGQAGEGYVRFAITKSEARIQAAIERMREKGIRY